MKPPPRDVIDIRAAAGRLDELSSALRAGRLAGLLKGKGLTRTTIDELLRPESTSRLKAILTDHLSLEWDRGAGKGRHNSEEDDSGHGPADGPCQGGKVLVYRAKETFRP
jgi:hypothetical protein